MVDGIGVDDNTCVLGVTLETAVGVDMRNVDMEVSKGLVIGDMKLIIVRVGVGVDITSEGIDIELEDIVSCGVGVDMGVLELVERVGIGVDITKEGIGIELEEEMNIVKCGVGVDMAVLDVSGI